MSHPSHFSPSPQQSGGGGTSVLVIVLVILGVLVVVCGGLCAGCVYVARRVDNSVGKELRATIQETMQLAQLSTAFAQAQEAATSDPQVVDRLGEPIELVSQPERQGTGNLKSSGETFQFDIKGPKGGGIVSAVAVPLSRDRNSIFVASKITVTFEDGSVVDVPVKAEEPPEDAKTTVP